MTKNTDLKILDLVRTGAKVTFVRYQDNELWYRCDQGFEFPVPLSDATSGVFLAQDKAIYFMRYINKHLDTIKSVHP